MVYSWKESRVRGRRRIGRFGRCFVLFIVIVLDLVLVEYSRCFMN